MRIIDQIRASRLPSNMMQFAARGALQVPSAENIEILVHLARHNKVFGELARITLAGWDVNASRAAASDPQTSAEVLEYFISPDNLRPVLLPLLLENPSISEKQLVKLAQSATRELIEAMLKSQRACSMVDVLEALQRSPYLTQGESEKLANLVDALRPQSSAESIAFSSPHESAVEGGAAGEAGETAAGVDSPENEEWVDDGTVSAYLNDHMHDIEAEGEKAFHAIGGIADIASEGMTETHSAATPESPAAPRTAVELKKPPVEAKRENSLQKISHLDVKGRIQLALKGNKEERSLLIRDGTKVVALAVLEAPKLSDGEVEKFASQKNVLEAVLRQIPLKRRFMKNYIVVRNLVANPRTPLDLGLGLMKNLLAQDLKNISANKEVSETIRKLALKMYKQKVESANKK